MEKMKVYTYPQKNGRVRGVVRIEIGELKVYPIRIMESEKGMFIAMPQQMRKNGTWQDLFHPITAEGRRFLQEKVLETYQAKQNGMKEFDLPGEITFSSGVTPVFREKSTLVGFAHVDIGGMFRIESILLRQDRGETEPKLVFPLRRWQNELGETMAAEIFLVGENMLSKMTETVQTEYHKKRTVLEQSEMKMKPKDAFKEFHQRDYKKEMGYSLDELAQMAGVRKDGKAVFDPFVKRDSSANSTVKQEEKPLEEEMEIHTEEPVMCL